MHALEFEQKQNRQIYWDDVALFCYPEEYQLGIRPMNKDDIIEVDNFSELVALAKILDCEVGDLCEAVQNDYSNKRTVQLYMHLDNVNGDVKISEEHTEFMWASIDMLKSLEISTSLKKMLEKKNWII